MDLKKVWQDLFKPRKKKSVVMISQAIINKQKEPKQPMVEQDEIIIDDYIKELAVVIKHDKPKSQTQPTKAHQPSLISQKLADINKRNQYFKDLEPWQVQKHNQTVSYKMMQQDYSLIYDTIINNKVTTMHDLDRLDKNTKNIILSKTADLGTFNKLVNICWSIQRDVPTKLGIHRMQHLTTRVSKAFK